MIPASIPTSLLHEVAVLVKEYGMSATVAIVSIVAVSLFFFYGFKAGYRVVIWFGKQIIEPVRDAIIAHLKDIGDAIKQFSTNDTQQTEILRRMDERLGNLEDGMREVGCPAMEAANRQRRVQASLEQRKPNASHP